MRDDRDIHADVGMQESLLQILFSYEYPWLRIGLEIVFGKIISLQKNKNKNSVVEGMPCMSGCSKWKNTLKSFIFENLFTTNDITDQFCKQKLLYVAQEKKMKEMLRKHMLQKFLILVLFLDRARTSYLLPKSTLFCRESLYKSSKDIVAAFCRYFLRGEGDIIRHLSLLGYNLNFSQTYVHYHE
jgi:abnormal spindle-like microcephaly-associated protein